MKAVIIDDCQWLFLVLGVKPEQPNYPGLPLGMYNEHTHQTLSTWFASECLPWVNENCVELDLLLINCNFKFRPDARRSDRHGIPLLQHIRLTKSLPAAARRAHIVLYSFQNERVLHGGDLSNLVIHSPSVTVLRLPGGLEKLKDFKHRDRWSKERRIDLDDWRQTRLFCLEPDDVLDHQYAHSFRNLAGVAKFLTEFAGDVVKSDEPVFKKFRELENSDLAYKRMLLRFPTLETGPIPSTEDVASFRRLTHEYKFLYIDDEHGLGWSLGLHAGLEGTCLPAKDYESLCLSTNAETRGGRLHILGSYHDAKQFLKIKVAEWHNALEAWTAACQKLPEFSAKMEEARRTLEKAEAEYFDRKGEMQEASKAFETSKREKDEIAAALSGTLTQFGTFSYSIAEQLVDSNPDEERALRMVLESKTLLASVGELAQKWEETRAAVKQDALMQAGIQETLKEAEREYQRRSAEFQRSQQTFDEVCQRAEQVSKRFSTFFPYSIVFLDLRLKHEDESCGPEGLSGWEMLSILNEHFPHIPVVMMTASEKALNSETARQRGAEGYWVKGLSTGAELREIILALLKAAKLARFWVCLQLIRHKACVVYLERVAQLGTKADELKFERKLLPQTDLKRREMEGLLEDSFWQLWDLAQQAPSRIPLTTSRNVLGAVYRNLGIVQDIRIRGMHQRWDREAGVEYKFRKKRNKLTHPEHLNKPIHTDWEETVEFMGHTLDELLKERNFALFQS